MKNYRKVGNGLSPSALQLRKRIKTNRSRAIRYGLMYLLGIVALAVVVMMAFPPIILHKPINIIELFKFLFSFEDMATIVLCVLYMTILVVVLLNVFRGFAKLKWLFKKTANDTHGFNRNVYAMLDLGRMFSGSFTVVLINYFLVALLSQVAEFDMVFYIMLAVGVVIHFWCGLGGTKTSFYDVDNGQVIEQKRVVGRFAPFLRNLLQVVAVIATMYFLLTFNVTNAILLPILEAVDAGTIATELPNMLWNILLVVAILVGLTVLTAHAMGISEYNIDGVEGKGMHMAYIFDILVLALTAVAIIMSGKMDAMELWIVAGIALVMAIIELVMWKNPKYPEDRIPMEKIDRNEEREMGLNDFSKVYADSVVESTMDKSQATREDMEKGYVENRAAMAAAQQKMYPNTQPGQPVSPYGTTYGNPCQHCAPTVQQQQGQLPQYPMYPMPYPVYPPQPQQQQSLLPLVAGMSILPMLANMSMYPNMRNNIVPPQGMDGMLPSQIVGDAIMRNGSARDIEKVLFSNSELSGKEARKAAKAREKALRMMARSNADGGADVALDEKAAMDEDYPIKIGVECPCCHKKLNVTSVALYNRCPSCKTVFQVRKSQD